MEKREIKFRAWDNENNSMNYDVDLNICKFNGDHVMQYTGLKDKNGKEIYEGDKCNCKMNGIETHIEYVETEVIYDLTVGGFGHKVISEGSDYKFFGLNSKNLLSCEVIGNIYENPDLINS